jgi:hypothetical protein
LTAGSIAYFSQAWELGQGREARIRLASDELLWKVLSPKRWVILKAMTGTGPNRVYWKLCSIPAWCDKAWLKNEYSMNFALTQTGCQHEDRIHTP